MGTLIENLNPDYSEKASILTGNLNRISVEVEDNIDKHFWHDVQKELYPEKEFHFNTYHTILDGEEKKEVKGKSRIMNMIGELKEYHIVDSDNDWILEEYFCNAKGRH